MATLSEIIKDQFAEFRKAFADVDALRAENDELRKQLAEAIDGAEGSAVALAEACGELEEARAEIATARGELDALRQEITSASEKAVEIVASIGQPEPLPVLTEGDEELANWANLPAPRRTEIMRSMRAKVGGKERFIIK